MPVPALLAGAGKVVSAALPVIGGWLGASGQRSANKANERMANARMSFEDAQAQRQMQFQERMSATAAQRSVDDFRKAGLNPALAYGTTAASPSGASGSGAQSVAENVAEAGMSSARQTASVKQALEIARAQSLADLALKEAHTQEAQIRARTTEEQGSLYRAQGINVGQQTMFNAQFLPSDLRKRFADATLAELLIPSARNEAALSTRLGELRPAIGTLFSGARSIGELQKLILRR